MNDVSILFVDRFLKGRPNALNKEGFEFLAAAKNLGIPCEIAGKDCEIAETEIPLISKDYALVFLSENYPEADDPWKWWDWRSVKTKKMFWAIDTHLKDFKSWCKKSKFNFIGFNNKNDMFRIRGVHSFYFPYGISKQRFSNTKIEQKERDVCFIGGMTDARKGLLSKYSIPNLQAFGEEYVRTLKTTKICFNKSISHDLNAKYLEILASGSFMLSNRNEEFIELIGDKRVLNMIYDNEEEIPLKISYYLEHEEEREELAREMNHLVMTQHTYEARILYMLKECGLN